MNIGNIIGIETVGSENFGVIPTMATTGDPRHQSRGDCGTQRPLQINSQSVTIGPIRREPDSFTPTCSEPSPTYPNPAAQRRLILARCGSTNGA